MECLALVFQGISVPHPPLCSVSWEANKNRGATSTFTAPQNSGPTQWLQQPPLQLCQERCEPHCCVEQDTEAQRGKAACSSLQSLRSIESWELDQSICLLEVSIFCV